MLLEEAGANDQHIRVALPHVHNIVVDKEVVQIMRQSDIQKAYTRVKLVR
jgi:hypothetical protein